MEVYDTVVSRLAMLGYEATEEDRPGIDYQIAKCRAELLADIHHRDVPEGLFYTLAELAAGAFLGEKLAAGQLEIAGLDFSNTAKSITEGDISVSFAGAGEAGSPEARFIAGLEVMRHPPERVLAAYRRLEW